MRRRIPVIELPGVVQKLERRPIRRHDDRTAASSFQLSQARPALMLRSVYAERGAQSMHALVDQFLEPLLKRPA